MRRTTELLLIVLAVAAVTAGRSPAAGTLSGGPEANAALRAPLTWPVPDGALLLAIPEGWEVNPRLAKDNNALAFLHPSGMTKGQAIPAWIVLERQTRPEGTSFSTFLQQCLEEGQSYGFVRQDSTSLRTSDGRDLILFRFNQSREGTERALGLLETPSGAILFRHQAVDEEMWARHEKSFASVFRSVRFLPRQ